MIHSEHDLDTTWNLTKLDDNINWLAIKRNQHGQQ